MNIMVLILAIAMVVPFPLEEIVGGYVRLLLVPIGLTLIIWWLIKNDQKKDRQVQ
jgi:membrane protease YdiL (CAAX protease family)